MGRSTFTHPRCLRFPKPYQYSALGLHSKKNTCILLKKPFCELNTILGIFGMKYVHPPALSEIAYAVSVLSHRITFQENTCILLKMTILRVEHEFRRVTITQPQKKCRKLRFFTFFTCFLRFPSIYTLVRILRS